MKYIITYDLSTVLKKYVIKTPMYFVKKLQWFILNNPHYLNFIFNENSTIHSLYTHDMKINDQVEHIYLLNNWIVLKSY